MTTRNRFHGTGFNQDMTEIINERKAKAAEKALEFGTQKPSRKSIKAKAARDEIERIKDELEVNSYMEVGG